MTKSHGWLITESLAGDGELGRLSLAVGEVTAGLKGDDRRFLVCGGWSDCVGPSRVGKSQGSEDVYVRWIPRGRMLQGRLLRRSRLRRGKEEEKEEENGLCQEKK